MIIDAISNGQSLSSILRQPNMPSYSWAKAQLRGDFGLRRQYDQAIEDRADRLAEELIELADEPMPDGLDGPGMSAWVQKLRVRIDARKWAASKLRPRAYGDRLEVAVQTPGISILEALQAAKRRVTEGRMIDGEVLEEHTPQLR
jgi:hypothetical protein